MFALKGGTAINLFYRDMPRRSVDIDLACLPVADRTAKAMAGLIAHVRSGRIAAGSRVLFVHTGGRPALFVYADSLGRWLSEAPDGRAR